MGLFVDNNGLPVSYKLFPGNTQDKTTFKEIIKSALNQQFEGKVIVVADNGIKAQENLYLLKEKDNGYIISKSVKRSWNKIRNWALDEDDYTVSNSSTFKYKSRLMIEY